METLIAIACNDHVIFAGSAGAGRSIIQFKDNEDKLHVVDDNKILASSGEIGDRVNFAAWVSRNLALNANREHRNLPGSSAAHFIRAELAKSIRSSSPYVVNCLFGSFDKPLPELAKLKAAGEAVNDGSGSQLYYLDYLGSLQRIPFGTQGYGGTFVTAILDRYWRPDQSVDESYELLRKCCDEVKKRIVISSPAFVVKVITKEGVKVLAPL
eukprot:TRINITY_DN2160_c0_g1_i1.p1 TRINITY_DN2160_c0_g1~~TRINITY_DN2160_c0_g1_i1.p1  ORF type:complete len:212 (-),score=23.01 TRINITY_DN2160_c0_g1_i1:17-652(-)